MTSNIIITIITNTNKILNILLQPIVLLSIRLFMAEIFLRAGIIKIEDMETTIYLFINEYKLPYISPYIAAYLATFLEISCSSLIIIGLSTRYAAGILLIMTIVIQTTYLNLQEHYLWMMMFATLMAFGGGTLSIDQIIYNKFKNQCK